MPVYEYRCPSDGLFLVKEPMMQRHQQAPCPDCPSIAGRVYSVSSWIYDHPKPLFHRDGSYEEK